MKPVLYSGRNSPNGLVSFLVVAIWLTTVLSLRAAPTLVSVVPADGATGVSVSSTVVFTFSEAMNTSGTFALFMDGTAYAIPSWSAGNKVLTCTPVGGWPSGAMVSWSFPIAMSALGVPVDPSPAGSFSTGSGGGGGGTGTNAITLLSVGRVLTYQQYSTGTPTLDTNNAYSFFGTTTLDSNRTATSIALAMPTTYTSNLTQNPVQPEFWFLTYYNTNQGTFDGLYPSGDYQFTIKAAASNQTVTVTLPVSMPQPAAPHTTRFTAAQSVDASQPFTISWDAFAGGGAADYITVSVGAWRSPDMGAAGALNGLATSIQLPANTLQPSSNYDAYISFYHFNNTSNATYGTTAYKATSTFFNLTTIGVVAAPPLLMNWAQAAGSMSFDVDFAAGQRVTVLSSTDVAAPIAQWPVLLTTNAPGTRFHVSDPRAATSQALYYRARNGN